MISEQSVTKKLDQYNILLTSFRYVFLQFKKDDYHRFKKV